MSVNGDTLELQLLPEDTVNAGEATIVDEISTEDTSNSEQSASTEPSETSSASSTTSSENEEYQPNQEDKIIQNSDVKFKVQGRLVYACRNVLCLLSPVFDSMFKSDFRERIQEEIDLPGKSAKAVINLVKVTHTRQEVTAENVYDVLPLCHEYQIEQLKAECESFLLKELDQIDITLHQEPLLQRYALYADVYELPRLKEVCVHKITSLPFHSFKNNEVYNVLSPDIKMAILTAKASANDRTERLVRNVKAVFQGKRDQKKMWSRQERKYYGVCDLTENGLHGKGSWSNKCCMCASYRYHLVAGTLKRSNIL